MEANGNEALRILEGKKVKIQTKSNLFYHTSNLQIVNHMIMFNDKFGHRVAIAISDILKIEEQEK